MTQIISQKGELRSFDVVVIGSGITGLSFILEFAQLCPHKKIALMSKATLRDSNSNEAQGGIASAFQSPDSIKKHVADTLAAGDQLCDGVIVDAILEEGPKSIQFLLDQGVPFDREGKNQLACGQEAGHTERRIYHCGDRTGAAIIQALLSKVYKLPNVSIFEHHIAINLITQDTNEVLGAYVLDETTDLIHTFLSNVVILATGGAGRVYRYTSNPDIATGDGVAMAYRTGAQVSGMEFYQFHPTLLYHPKINNFLISEALRGEGAYLCLPKTGERFMKRYAPKVMELATRDVVARAIFCEMEQNNLDFVYLDVRHKDKFFLQNRFPVIIQKLSDLGLDVSKDLIPVVPAAHYMCGGVASDTSGRTNLRRLFAIGETASTGLHGANRLASNSLLEGVVMGRNAAHACIESVNDMPKYHYEIPLWDSKSVVDLRRASQIHVHWRGLRGEMSAYAGIIRTEAGLRDQLQLILTRREMIEAYYWKHQVTRDLIELRNIILVAELIVLAALNRPESRGGHYREDFLNDK